MPLHHYAMWNIHYKYYPVLRIVKKNTCRLWWSSGFFLWFQCLISAAVMYLKIPCKCHYSSLFCSISSKENGMAKPNVLPFCGSETFWFVLYYTNIFFINQTAVTYGWMTMLSFVYSLVLPEKLEYIVSKYAEHSHDKWAFDKVGIILIPATVRKGLVNNSWYEYCEKMGQFNW